ncbi:BolA/IbaG family iron-sulfur metabolism protein [Buchnera aphidicola (Mindarus keteleerifoliae)]|uniref:BolA/IbaG family iron-sulfur metabolism protein n=1 Tax=Buchnera aphidicola TaxID=9 RepID=UPI0031B71985
MMKKTIKSLLLKEKFLEKVYIKGDNYHLKIIAISKKFITMEEKNKQQIIYSPLTKLITSNKIHALTIETYTPKEWEIYKKKTN